LNELKNQRAVEQNERNASEATPQEILLRDMLDESAPQKDFDTVERAEEFFKKSADDERERLDSFTEWIESVAEQTHPEPMYSDDEPAESVQLPIEPSQIAGEQTPSLEIQNVDLEMLVSELDANPLEAKKEAEAVEAENNNY
jgi:hypothetical protein